jgi:hypothetical protein
MSASISIISSLSMLGVSRECPFDGFRIYPFLSTRNEMKRLNICIRVVNSESQSKSKSKSQS